MKMTIAASVLALLFTSGCSMSHESDKFNTAKKKLEEKIQQVNETIAEPKNVIKPQKQLPDNQLLNVPLLNQMTAPRLYNGCEVTSLAMLLQYRGIKVTKNDLAKAIKRVPLTYDDGKKGNPNAGFVGNMEVGPGLGVFHGPTADLAKKYAGNKVIDLSGKPFGEIIKNVGNGSPVWIITTTIFAPVDDFISWNTPEGPIKVTYKEHSVVITGYDQENIYVNDPYGHKNRKLPKENFIKAWEQMGKQALTISE